MDNWSGVLDRFLAARGRPAWEVTAEDVDRVVGELVAQGLATATRRGYVQAFKGFHRFLVARKAAEIEAVFGVRLADPVDEFNAPGMSGMIPGAVAAADAGAAGEFFEFMKDGSPPPASTGLRPGTMRCSGRCITPACGRRRPRRWSMPTCTSVAARSASCTCGSARPRTGPGRGRGGCRCSTAWTWCCGGSSTRCGRGSPTRRCCSPMRAAAGCTAGRSATGCAYLPSLEGRPAADRFSPHALRRACATHNYERGVDLVAIQQMLGHWTVGSTMRYVRPSATFIEDAYRRAVSTTLADWRGDHDEDQVAAADGRRSARGLDRRPAAATARRAGRTAAVLGVGVRAVRPRALPR